MTSQILLFSTFVSLDWEKIYIFFLRDLNFGASYLENGLADFDDTHVIL